MVLQSRDTLYLSGMSEPGSWVPGPLITKAFLTTNGLSHGAFLLVVLVTSPKEEMRWLEHSV